jgi:hypothetical protein
LNSIAAADQQEKAAGLRPGRALHVLGLALGTTTPQAHAGDWHDWRDHDNHWVGTWAASPQSV